MKCYFLIKWIPLETIFFDKIFWFEKMFIKPHLFIHQKYIEISLNNIKVSIHTIELHRIFYALKKHRNTIELHRIFYTSKYHWTTLNLYLKIWIFYSFEYLSKYHRKCIKLYRIYCESRIYFYFMNVIEFVSKFQWLIR